VWSLLSHALRCPSLSQKDDEEKAMRHLAKHFEKSARHHEQVSDEHTALHKLHTEHAAHHADEGEHVKAAHHREVATHHKRLAKLHDDHSEHCSTMAKEALEPDTRSGMADVDNMRSTGKLSDVDFIKAVVGID
jgi:hypothetical protein